MGLSISGLTQNVLGGNSGIMGRLQRMRDEELARRKSGVMWGRVDPNTIRENMLQGMPTEEFSDLAGEYGSQAGQQFGMQNQLFGQGMGLMQGESPILRAIQQQLSGQVSSGAAQQSRTQQQALAARGMGGGGLSNILSNQNQAQAGQAMSQGLLGIQKYGLEAGSAMTGQAQGFGQIGMQGLGGQGNALGSLGAIMSQANQGQNAQIQTNAANKASWLQAEAARRRAEKSKRGGLLGGIVGGIAGFALGGPAGAQAGYSLGSSIGS